MRIFEVIFFFSKIKIFHFYPQHVFGYVYLKISASSFSYISMDNIWISMLENQPTSTPTWWALDLWASRRMHTQTCIIFISRFHKTLFKDPKFSDFHANFHFSLKNSVFLFKNKILKIVADYLTFNVCSSVSFIVPCSLQAHSKS